MKVLEEQAKEGLRFGLVPRAGIFNPNRNLAHSAYPILHTVGNLHRSNTIDHLLLLFMYYPPRPNYVVMQLLIPSPGQPSSSSPMGVGGRNLNPLPPRPPLPSA